MKLARLIEAVGGGMGEEILSFVIGYGSLCVCIYGYKYAPLLEDGNIK